MHKTRLAGVVLPLFSIRTRRDWGVGQITDLPAAGAWIRSAGHTLLQVLPPYELAAGETSPYGARTTFGLDPLYIDVDAVPDLDAAGRAAAQGGDGAAVLARCRESRTVLYGEVRSLKARALTLAFDRFYEREWLRGTERAKELRRFIDRERSWVDDLALYVALREAHGGFGWQTWPEGERSRDRATLDEARRTHERAILAYQYAQWVALTQWEAARRALTAMGVELMGDLPFIVGAESACVWANTRQFRLDVSLGAPPDGFSEDGQNWGLPAYDWAAMDSDDLAWIRARARHAARLYDRFRLDHVVGYFRQYVRHPGERGTFDPSSEDAQHARGDKVLSAIVAAAGDARVIAEDLGVIPRFVRETLARLDLPGYRVLPWERDEHHHLRHPDSFPRSSVATWSTHDTSPITLWWDEMAPYERDDFSRLFHLPPGLDDGARLRHLLRALYGAQSDLVLVLAQELLGERERINTPGTVGGHNWAYRLPSPIEDLERDGALRERMGDVLHLVEAAGRFTR